MSVDYLELKKKRAMMKKDNPIAWKFNHIRAILGRVQSSICMQMNWCGWTYKPGTNYEQMDYWYRWELENYNHTQSYAFKQFSPVEMKKITVDVQRIALEYFKKAFELYQKGYRLSHGGSPGLYGLNCNWFEKNIKKFETIK